MQFCNIYNAHKAKTIAKHDLHWGEESEYSLYYFDAEGKRVKIACDAAKLIAVVNEKIRAAEEDPQGFTLLPEYGNWMIEAVPIKPYGNYSDPEQLLSTAAKLLHR